MDKNLDILVIGHKGLIGGAIYKKLLSEDCKVIGITKEDSVAPYKTIDFDIVINANGNSKRFKAKDDPYEDFIESSVSVYKSINDFKFNKYIYISSVDAMRDNTYGFHKKISEDIISHHCKNYLILRCCVVLGKNMKKGVVKDIIDGSRVFLTPNSESQYITNEEVSNIVLDSIINDIQGTKIVSTKNSINVEDIGKLLNKEIFYSDQLKENHYIYSSDFKTGTSEEYIIKTVKEI